MSSSSPRNIRTEYYNHKAETLKVNNASSPRSAILRAVDHLQTNTYGAKVADIFDNETAELYAVVVSDLHGKISIAFQKHEIPVCIMLPRSAK